MSLLIERIYHPYWKWEEVKFNMWGKVVDREKYLKFAIRFTGNHNRYGKYMLRVIRDFKYSCEHNLSDLSQNRQAWIGHAACARAFRCPEDIVREVWHNLTDEQRLLANKMADTAISLWEKSFSKKGKVENGQKVFEFECV